jgi:hypothetical protein
LDDDFLPIEHKIMDESNIEMESDDRAYSVGLEDIRLYEEDGKVKFIATNVNYIGGRANRIIIGDYDYENNSYLNSKIIQPPTNTTCEKNWIPILLNQQMHFIYKWNPFQLSKINDESSFKSFIN